jgi:hypothetical protein
VNIRLIQPLKRPISLRELQCYTTSLQSLELLHNTEYTEITPVTLADWQFVVRLSFTPEPAGLLFIQQSSTPNIHFQEVHIIRKLGRGSYGDVFLAKCRGNQVAVKILHKQALDPNKLEEFKREVRILRLELILVC